ncbi:hypothetical protein Ahu01nite_087480 [Winogradskya humida]|uniref:Uncharacterized protein n=2 Tax=Winogradskya humida TaxID=113566 RepID=A0ABQ4A462_9ACTN|nr:hypothetical protein Ahu01nite_087480 [Actinoplanes humidus]
MMAGVRHVAIHVDSDRDVVLGAYVVAGSVVAAELGVRGMVLRCLTAGGATLVRCAAVPIRPPVD